jgi:hypothetical protein
MRILLSLAGPLECTNAGLMHKHVTHNRCHATFADFKAAILTFLREAVPRKWHTYCGKVTDYFRIISPKDFRILA